VAKKRRCFFRQRCYFNNVPLFFQIFDRSQYDLLLELFIQLNLQFRYFTRFHFTIHAQRSTIDYADQPLIRDHAMYKTIYVIRICSTRANLHKTARIKPSGVNVNQNSLSLRMSSEYMGYSKSCVFFIDFRVCLFNICNEY